MSLSGRVTALLRRQEGADHRRRTMILDTIWAIVSRWPSDDLIILAKRIAEELRQRGVSGKEQRASREQS